MKTLRIPYAPSLDGFDLCNVAEQMETCALRQSIDIVNWEQYPYKPVVTFDIARGDKELYLHYFVRGLSLRAVADEDGQYVHPDSCVEFFMRRHDDLRYTNFEFNCIGTCLAARGTNRHNRESFTQSEYQQIRRHATLPRIAFDERHGIYAWELTVAIPFSLMGFDASCLPDKMRGNFYKCADSTAYPHYLTWSPVDLPKPDYHCPEHFGELCF